MDNWKVIITTRCLNTNITQDEITLEVLTTDSTVARRVAMQRLYRDKHIAALDAENAQLREALRDAVSLIDPLMETTDEPYTEWDAVAIAFLDTATALTEGETSG